MTSTSKYSREPGDPEVYRFFSEGLKRLAEEGSVTRQAIRDTTLLVAAVLCKVCGDDLPSSVRRFRQAYHTTLSIEELERGRPT